MKHKFLCGCVFPQEQSRRTKSKTIRCPVHGTRVDKKIFECRWCGWDIETSPQTGYRDTCPLCKHFRDRLYAYRLHRQKQYKSQRRDNVNVSDGEKKGGADWLDVGDYMNLPVITIPTLDDFPGLKRLVEAA